MRNIAIVLLLIATSHASPSPTVLGRFHAGVIDVDGAGFAPGTALKVSADVTWRHASIACNAAWSQVVHADRAGRVRLRLAPRGECAFARERHRIYVGRAGGGDDLAVSPPF